MSMLYHIVTYGCQMNVHESEKISFILENMGYQFTPNREDADVIVFNTCAIREGAEERVFGNVGALKKLKKSRPELVIAVCGCMTQKEETAKRFKQKFPFVDVILGTFNLHKIGEYVAKAKNQKVFELWSEGELDEEQGYNRSSGKNAWVNIMQGCNNFCTYCIVPYVRGREHSRSVENILSEVKQIAASGQYDKITLLGQNVNSYGKDLSPSVSFAELLRLVTAANGDFKVGFMTSHPKDLTDELIEEIATNDKVLKEIHLPAQSGNNRILKLMNRKYTRELYLSIIEKIKSRIPNVKITSDFIVGFPTETEEEFEDTMSLVEKVKFDGIFAFMYSPREGTVAAKMEDQIPLEVKKQRVNKLLALEKKIQKEAKKCQKK